MVKKEKDLNEKEISFRFKVSGNIIKRFGEESISNKNVAILELIKNSYDAGAKKVEVFLKNETIPEYAELIISDDGDGMSNEDLENKWMNIASSHKKEEPIKKNSRILVGEKGIGRLSAQSLGNKTILISKPKGESRGYNIFFDWDKYQKKGIYVNEIVNKGFSFNKLGKEHGTRVEISELKHDWEKEEVKRNLLTDIYLLNPPNKPMKDFKVIYPYQDKDVPTFKKIRKSFLNKATYSLKTKLTRGGTIKYEFSTINEKKKEGRVYLTDLKRKLKCGDATFELFFYYRTENSLKNATGIDISSSDIKEIKDILEDYQGIKLYRDNFRVKPYGERGSDWIGLEIEAQNKSICPRNNSIFGMVHISKSNNPDITDTTTREGVIMTDEFRDLIYFVKYSILNLFIDLRSEEESYKVKARKTSKTQRIDEKISRLKIEPEEITVEDIQKKEERLIEVKGEYPLQFYYPLEQEINDCYSEGFPNAVLFLGRKMIESLVFEILEKKFQKEKEIWWDTTYNQPLSLSPLIRKLEENKRRFGVSIQRYISRVIPSLKKIKDKANPTSHNVYDYITNKNELVDFKFGDTVQFLVKIYNLI